MLRSVFFMVKPVTCIIVMQPIFQNQLSPNLSGSEKRV